MSHRHSSAASYREPDTFTRAELIAARAGLAEPEQPKDRARAIGKRAANGGALPVGRYSRRNATADRHQHRPTPIRYPAGTVYVCRCGWRDARANDTALPATLTA